MSGIFIFLYSKDEFIRKEDILEKSRAFKSRVTDLFKSHRKYPSGRDLNTSTDLVH